MTTPFIDTAVLMYAAGAEHPLRDSCRRVMLGIRSGQLQAVTSVEVVQELLHRFISLRRPDVGRQLASDALDTFAPVLPVTHALIRRVPELAARYPSLAARDLVHVATCVHEGITEIVSPDRAFDEVAELRRVDPIEFAATLA
ncbi:MAG TPA: type II toxin-antitoxin system VapC family toxin [Clostridia bacterium]|nr:type II toxin-antitoxin system VapC family toxin [Clostridia bacterium]